MVRRRRRKTYHIHAETEEDTHLVDPNTAVPDRKSKDTTQGSRRFDADGVARYDAPWPTTTFALSLSKP